jgi:hypothetical protein
MKKVLFVGDLQSIERAKLDSALIVVGRVGEKYWLQNLELPAGTQVKTDPDGITIRIMMKPTDYLVMGEKKDFVEKIEL